MIAASVRHRLEDREERLSPYAARSRLSVGRERAEESCPVRTEFQRDRDRIIHSKSFRRLKHKTQVFIRPSGDHYVTRLTHTLEVSQIARTIVRALNLNEDLVEAISLGHDLGHTPFGHVGEAELDRLNPVGFRHAEQGLRVVEMLEKDGQGLNLTWEVRHGIVSHSKPRDNFLDVTGNDGLSLEAQVCRVSDAVAYLNHDLADAFRAGILRQEDLPVGITSTLGERHSQRINTMVSDIVAVSWAATSEEGGDRPERPSISMSEEVGEAANTLRKFMFRRVYGLEDRGEAGEAARKVIRLLYEYFMDHQYKIPLDYSQDGRSVVDYIASMTDEYAIRVAEGIRPGVSGCLRRPLA